MFKMDKIKIAIIILTAIMFVSIIYISCSKNDDKQSDIPEIVGCNSVKYKGYTYTNLGCAQGIASFDVTTTQGGHTASFHITCSNGCISSVTVGSGPVEPVLGPE